MDGWMSSKCMNEWLHWYGWMDASMLLPIRDICLFAIVYLLANECIHVRASTMWLAERDVSILLPPHRSVHGVRYRVEHESKEGSIISGI
jgi:hypothetical protein